MPGNSQLSRVLLRFAVHLRAGFYFALSQAVNFNAKLDLDGKFTQTKDHRIVHYVLSLIELNEKLCILATFNNSTLNVNRLFGVCKFPVGKTFVVAFYRTYDFYSDYKITRSNLNILRADVVMSVVPFTGIRSKM